MQLNYNAEMDAAFEGMLADSGRIDALSKTIEGAGLEFGLGCTLGSEEGTVAALTAITEKFQGVLIHKHVTDGEVGDEDTIALLRKGRVYVKVEEAVVEGDSVFVRAVAAGAERAGAFRKTQDGTDCIAVSGAEFRSSAAAGGLAILDLNLPA